MNQTRHAVGTPHSQGGRFKPIDRDEAPSRLLEHDSMRGASATDLNELSYSRDPKIRRMVASDRRTAAATLVRMAKYQPYSRAAALANPAFPIDEASRIVDEKRASDHLSLLKNPDLDPAIVDRIARLSSQAQWAAARHPRVTTDTLSFLSSASSPEVLKNVARHPSASLAARERAMERRVAVIELGGHAADFAAGQEELASFVKKTLAARVRTAQAPHPRNM